MNLETSAKAYALLEDIFKVAEKTPDVSIFDVTVNAEDNLGTHRVTLEFSNLKLNKTKTVSETIFTGYYLKHDNTKSWKEKTQEELILRIVGKK